MFAVEVYAAVRRFVFVDGNSRREAARVFGVSRETVAKMCRFSLPPGYTRTRPVEKPKLGPLLPVIDSILQVLSSSSRQGEICTSNAISARRKRPANPRKWSIRPPSITTSRSANLTAPGKR